MKKQKETYAIATNGGNHGMLKKSFVFFDTREKDTPAIEPIIAYDLEKIIMDPEVQKIMPKYQVSYQLLPGDVLNDYEIE